MSTACCCWACGACGQRAFALSTNPQASRPPSGIGKTALRLAQIIALATKHAITGEHIFQRCRVLLVSFEDCVATARQSGWRGCLAIRCAGSAQTLTHRDPTLQQEGTYLIDDTGALAMNLKALAAARCFRLRARSRVSPNSSPEMDAEITAASLGYSNGNAAIAARIRV
jgi:hypothetical protein